MAAHFRSNLQGYISLDPIFMMNLHVYHVLDEDFAHKIFLMYTESGIFVDTFDTIKKRSTDFVMKENRLYRTPKEYVDDFVSFDNLGIGNFNGIFTAYFVFCSLISIVFVIHLIIKIILSRRASIRRWKTDYFDLILQRFLIMKNRIVSCL